MVVKKFFAALLCFFISLGILTYISSDMLLYFTDKNFMKDILEKKIKENIDNESIEMLITGCKFDPSFSISVQEINFSCSEFLGKDYSEIIKYISDKVATNFYERKIDCEIIDCLSQKKFDALLSEKANVFFADLKIKSIYVTFFLVVLLLIVTRSFISWSRKLGYTLLFTALPLYAFNFFLPKTIETMVPSEAREFIPLIVERLSSSNFILLVISIIGFSLFVLSYIIEEIKKKRKSKVRLL